MITLRRSHERGRPPHGGWLQSAHSFSFEDYFDLRHQGHGNLLVIKDDTVVGGKGFGTHSHRDMEIISYVLEAAQHCLTTPYEKTDARFQPTV